MCGTNHLSVLLTFLQENWWSWNSYPSLSDFIVKILSLLSSIIQSQDSFNCSTVYIVSEECCYYAISHFNCSCNWSVEVRKRIFMHKKYMLYMFSCWPLNMSLKYAFTDELKSLPVTDYVSIQAFWVHITCSF